MCTISYHPVGDRHYIFTQNRDESPLRPAPEFPFHEGKGSNRVYFAKDPVGGGTWMASSGIGRTVGLMNGGFQPHIPSPPYKHSRGLVVTGMHRFGSIGEFREHFSFFGLEPFTLIIRDDEGLHQLVWTGDEEAYFDLDPLEPHLFMSNQLYSKPAQTERRQFWSEKLKKDPSPDPGKLWDLHQDPSMVLKRPEVATTGISQFVFLPEEKKFTYSGYPSGNTQVIKIQ